MHTYRFYLAPFALLLPVTAHTAPFNFEFGAASWNYSPSGDVEYVENNGNDDQIDLSRDDPGLGLERDRDLSFWGHIEHPVPLLPNIRLSYTRIDTAGEGELHGTTFGDTEYLGPVDSTLKLDQYDTTLYYKPIRRFFSLDLGLNIKYIDGEATVEDVTGEQRRERASFSGPLPMLYGRLGYQFPTVPGLSIGAGGSVVAYSSNRVTDLQADIAYRTRVGLGIVAGYREQRIKLDDVDDVELDARIDGMFVGAFFNF